MIKALNQIKPPFNVNMQKHGDRKIDFEVVLQNGRVGLKPKIK